MSHQEETLTVEEAAEFLKVSKKTVYFQIKHNRLPMVKLGKEYRGLKSDLILWFQQRTQSDFWLHTGCTRP